ncbi:class I SAM-dependent methyltransferase [Naasia sp. SYSU D00948]|uniref:class I SAM-dependent methyltransferase n=1 Tax=Naasia sp. SYSU D00948 TaxID=2817379 RepID=UPI001B315A39|nr:class I SAM-dependent methyltransferase [Naasia sp. SYSU D00948]
MRADEVRELLSVEGLRLLDRIPPYRSGSDVLRTSAELRKAGHSPALVAAVLTQARLRERAKAKFGDFAERMLFTEAGLEQATRLPVAALHAGRYARAGLPLVADLGCGIGGDAMALAALDREVLAVERDESTAALAAYNLAPFPSVTVTVGDAESTPLPDGAAVFLDPARRTTGSSGRRVSADEWTPSLDFCFRTAAERPTGMKLAPGFDRSRIPEDLEAQWVTAGGETVELTLWSGPLARPGVRRSAVVLGPQGTAELTAAEDSPDAAVAALGRYVFEPAGSVIRARLIGDLARAVGAGMLSEGIAYLTGDALPDSPFLAAFEVVAVLPLDEKRISRELRDRGIGRLEIKKRGVDVDPAAFRKRLSLRGEGEATLLLAPVGGKRTAILATRAGQPGSVTAGASTAK